MCTCGPSAPGTALGGLICGLLARYGSRQIIGHGIPEAMEAVWINLSKVKPRIFFLKPLSAAIAIGTGAPFGVEGPIIQGGRGDGLDRRTMDDHDGRGTEGDARLWRRRGDGATFNTPLAAIFWRS